MQFPLKLHLPPGPSEITFCPASPVPGAESEKKNVDVRLPPVADRENVSILCRIHPGTEDSPISGGWVGITVAVTVVSSYLSLAVVPGGRVGVVNPPVPTGTLNCLGSPGGQGQR